MARGRAPIAEDVVSRVHQLLAETPPPRTAEIARRLGIGQSTVYRIKAARRSPRQRKPR